MDLRPVDRWLVVGRDSRRSTFYVRSAGGSDRDDRGRRPRHGDADRAVLRAVEVRSAGYPILGAFAFETSGYSKLSDWPGGGVVGVHGTPWPYLLGRAVSHGCVRIHNDDALFLRDRMPVGTRIKIVPA